MKIKRVVGSFLALSFASTLMCMSASALGTTNEGITAEIVTDDNYYSNNENAEVTVKVTNNNDFDVTNVNIKGFLPEGLVYENTSSDSLTEEKLEAGETISLKLNVKKSTDTTSSIKENDGSSVSEIKDESSDISENIKDNSDKGSLTSDDKSSKTDSNTNSIENSEGNNATAVLTDSSSSESENKQPDTGNFKRVSLSLLFVVLLFGGIIICYRSNKSAKKTLSFIVGLAMGGTVIGSYGKVFTASAEEFAPKFFTTKTVYFNDKEYTIKAGVSYDSIKNNSNKTYTRGDWIKLLAEENDINTDHFATRNWFYGDTYGTDDGKLYELMHSLGVIPESDNEGYRDPAQDVALFEADKIVTREYAAYTAVKVMRFLDEEPNLTCSDAGLIKYKSAVSIALKFKMFTLTDNKFNPQAPITENDKNQIIAVMRATDEDTIVKDDEQTESVSYADNVIADSLRNVKDYTVTDVGDGKYKVILPSNDVTKNFDVNTIFVLPETEGNNGYSFKVISLSLDNNNVTAICKVPEFQEVVKGLQLRKSIQPEATDFVPAEGINCKIVDSAEKTKENNIYPYDFDTSSASLSVTIPEIDGEVTFSIPKVSVDLETHTEWFVPVIDEFTFAVTSKTEFGIDLKSTDIGDDNSIELGSFDIPLGYGFAGRLTAYLYVEAEAKLTVGFNVEILTGIQYTNGSFRNPSTVDAYFDKLALEGSASAGPSATANVSWTVFNLAGVELKTGVGLEGSVTAHPEANLTCIDASAYVPLGLGISSDSLLGDLMDDLGIDLSIDIWNSDSSPFSENLHIENLVFVDECTYGKGAIDICVKNEKNEPISNAQVIVTPANNNESVTLFTDSEGKLLFKDLDAGSYKVEIKATNYAKYKTTQFVMTNETTYMEAVMMILRDNNNDGLDDEGENTASGSIYDAVTGNLINANYVVRKGSNNTTGDVVKNGSSDNGKYSVSLPYGYYTITFSLEGYYDSSINVNITNSNSTFKDVTLSNKLNGIDSNANLRIVLTWGENPSDLDSHLLSKSNTDYHTYFSDKKYYQNGKLMADLDLDDTTSYGPETTTIYDINENDYFSFYVHDFSNRYIEDDTELSNSTACVKVYSGENIVQTFYVPTGKTGNLWHVFDYDPITKKIIPINSFSNCEDYEDYFINRY